MKYDCNWPNNLYRAKYWNSIDSVSMGAVYYNTCYGNIPSNSFTYQFPRTGQAFISNDFFCESLFCNPSYNRGYFKNRLKSNLQAGTIYCVKFFVNISNNSTYGIDRFEAYFGGSSVDTITKCTLPLTYLTPQISNAVGNIITDTLNWSLVTGTFVASGNEKYLILGNFKPDNQTDTLMINPTYLPAKVTDVAIDDISCIPLDLPAFAGNDTTCISGTSVYIGRQQDVGIDEACMWYKLPTVITPTTPALDTAAGIWVSPTQTSTYVVRQEICGIVKWDTVVVRQDWTGIRPYNLLDGIRTYPNPANDRLFFNYPEALENERMSLRITDLLGASIREEEIQFRQRQLSIDVQSLPAGTYFAILKDRSGVQKYEKLIIER